MKAFIVLIGGLAFGVGLAVSGLAKQELVLSFLRLEDLGLLLTMGAALAVTLPIYQLAPRLRSRPIVAGAFCRFPPRVTMASVGGGALFGVGWGLSGVCPGSVLASLGLGNLPALWAIGGMLVGAWLQGVIADRSSASSSAPGSSSNGGA